MLIEGKNFDGTIDGSPVGLYTLKSKNGLTAQITNYGGRLVSLFVPNANGEFEDVVLGQDTLEEYLQPSAKYFGATIGRYGNRIANGQFTLGGVTYQLEKNNGPNHLHGGIKGFESVVWSTKEINEEALKLTYQSKDGEEGYPGHLSVQLEYRLTDANQLRINYKAETDKPTVVNLTHHSFFNLCGAGHESIKDHIVQINAEYITPVDGNLIPTGKILSILETPMDFAIPTPIGQRIDSEYEQLRLAGGYDHNYVLNIKEGDLGLAAEVLEPISKRAMKVYTTEPGMQFYTGNFLDGAQGKGGRKYGFRSAFCMETQHYPDSPNQKHFPTTLLRPGETYESTTIYEFGVKG